MGIIKINIFVHYTCMGKRINDYNIDEKRKKFERRFNTEHDKFRTFTANNLRDLRFDAFKGTVYEHSAPEQFNIVSVVTGLSVNTLRKIESGKENFTYESFLRLSCFYDMPPHFIVKSGGAEEYKKQQRSDSFSSTKLRNNIASVGWKEVAVYFDGGTPVMRKTDGSTRVFEVDDTIILQGNSFNEFRLTFFVGEDGKQAIFHHVINNETFRTIGLKQITSMNIDFIGYPVCSSVLTLCWKDDLRFTMAVKKEPQVGIKNYLKDAGID